ncbi:hypothetical protein FNV43_RR27226 [Rhamnella rubrinervis]|uniref:Uncharacterized protein n=1 Tax=Rhamnella rubrinervis TaxID=2594499 RepID=A0A8K0DL91_9ROSA|nr:hypothetical protein FNV43_RR27226 [Rhamnella rubrinervis]
MVSSLMYDDCESDVYDNENIYMFNEEISLFYNFVMGDEANKFAAIQDMFFSVGLDTVDPNMVHNILNCAETMSTDRKFTDRKVLRMEIDIEIFTEAQELTDDEDDEEEECEYNHEGASEQCIEKLQKAKVEDGSNQCGCCICCEIFLIGFEATFMPCSQISYRLY